MKSLIQYDGSNFYNKVKKIFPDRHLTNFKYKKLAENISTNTKNKVVYYIGEVKYYRNNLKSKVLFSNQQSLFLNLRKENIQIKLGYLLKSDGVFHEKGVDVQIAVDIVRGSIKNEFDKVYLISSDTDLIPAIKTAKREGKEVIYVGFENYISKALMKNCSSYIILKKAELIKFFN